MKSMKFFSKVIAFTILLSLISVLLFAQSNRFNNGFFNANLIVNPSLPNVGNSMNANLTFKSPINNSMPGLQKDIGFEFNTPFLDASAGGINILKQSAGILTKQYLLFNYAADIRLSENAHIRTGLAFGFRDIRLNNDVISQSYSSFFGNASDPVILAYTSKPPSFYSGLGFTFYNKNLDIQLVVPNLSYYFKKADSSFEDKPVILGLGYLIPMDNTFLGLNSNVKVQAGYLKNLLAYQQGNVFSAGATVSSAEGISVELFYNSNGVLNTGVGIDILDKYALNFNYIIGGVNSTIIYGGSGQAIISFRFKMPKLYINK